MFLLFFKIAIGVQRFFYFSMFFIYFELLSMLVTSFYLVFMVFNDFPYVCLMFYVIRNDFLVKVLLGHDLRLCYGEI